MIDLIKQLIHFSCNYDFIKEDLTEDFLKNYFIELLYRDRLIIDFSDKLIGYIEYWNINFEQLGRLMCIESFNIFEEDIESGHICYVSNITVHPNYRLTDSLNRMKQDLFKRNENCKYFTGVRNKKTSPVKIFKKEVIQHGYV